MIDVSDGKLLIVGNKIFTNLMGETKEAFLWSAVLNNFYKEDRAITTYNLKLPDYEAMKIVVTKCCGDTGRIHFTTTQGVQIEIPSSFLCIDEEKSILLDSYKDAFHFCTCRKTVLRYRETILLEIEQPPLLMLTANDKHVIMMEDTKMEGIFIKVNEEGVISHKRQRKN